MRKVVYKLSCCDVVIDCTSNWAMLARRCAKSRSTKYSFVSWLSIESTYEFSSYFESFDQSLILDTILILVREKQSWASRDVYSLNWKYDSIAFVLVTLSDFSHRSWILRENRRVPRCERETTPKTRKQSQYHHGSSRSSNKCRNGWCNASRFEGTNSTYGNEEIQKENAKWFSQTRSNETNKSCSREIRTSSLTQPKSRFINWYVVQNFDRKFIEQLEIRREKIEMIWANHSMRYEDVNARPYTLNTTNVEYVIDMFALDNHNDLSTLGSNFVAQESLKSEWVFYWDGSIKVKYSGSSQSILLSLFYK